MYIAIVLSVNNNLFHVRSAILDAASQWRDIGQALRIPNGTLTTFHGEDNECLNMVLTSWMHTGKATIHQLLEALESDIVGRGDIVTQLRSRQGEDRKKIGLA